METIKDFNEFSNILKIEENIDVVKTNLNEIIKIIKSGNLSGTPYNRKYLENILEFIIKYIIENLQINKAKYFIEKFLSIIIDLANMFQEKFNEKIREFLRDKCNVSYSEAYLNTAILNFINEKNQLDTNILSQITKVGILFCFLTYNIKQTNQLISNFILLCSFFINQLKLNIENKTEIIAKLSFKLILISIVIVISENISCYNPDIINSFNNLLHFFLNFVLISNDINNYDLNEKTELSTILKYYLGIGHDLNLFEFKKLENAIDKNNDNDTSNIWLLCYLKKILSINYDLIKIYKDDINFNLIFRDNIRFLKTVENFCSGNFQNNNNINHEFLSFYLENYEKKINEIYSIYDSQKDKCLAKKNVQINFLLLKAKAIPSLEPEFDFGPIDFKTRKEKIQKAISVKIKKTKKQAIRNLKKESKILDQERQKVMKKLEHKRQEDLKFANQFAEQSNLEYKKMVTSNPKKRYKLKRGKINKK